MEWNFQNGLYEATGTIGSYFITPICTEHPDYELTVHRKSDGAIKTIGGFMSLNNAKSAAERYENYRSY